MINKVINGAVRGRCNHTWEGATALPLPLPSSPEFCRLAGMVVINMNIL